MQSVLAWETVSSGTPQPSFLLKRTPLHALLAMLLCAFKWSCCCCIVLRQKASPNDNHLRLSNATLCGGVPRSVVIFYACAEEGGGKGPRGKVQGFLFWPPPTMAYECITKHTLPRPQLPCSLSDPSPPPHTTFLYPSLLIFLSLYSCTALAALSFDLVANVRNDANDVFLLRPWQLLQLQSVLSHSPPLPPPTTHNLHINLIFLLCMSAKKLSPSPKVFTTCILMDFK